MTVEERMREWLKQPGTAVMPGETQFIVDMRKAALHGVGYGWMQQVIEWEWQSKAEGAWGPEYFGKRIKELEAGEKPKNDWQPIEAASKDKDLLLWGKYWSDEQGYMPCPMIGRWSRDRWEVWSYGGRFGVRPTVWCEIPTQPEDEVVLRRAPGVYDILKDYIKFINDRPELMSLLYDIDMLPEQTITHVGAVRLAGLCEVWKRYEEAKGKDE